MRARRTARSPSSSSSNPLTTALFASDGAFKPVRSSPWTSAQEQENMRVSVNNGAPPFALIYHR